MNTKDFLKGYFFAAQLLSCSKDNHLSSLRYTIDIELVYVHIFTQNEGELHFAINRGISPLGGRVASCTIDLNEALFDIAINWVSPTVWTMVLSDYPEGNEYGEVRLTFYQLCKLVDQLGGIDFEKTILLYNKSENTQ